MRKLQQFNTKNEENRLSWSKGSIPSSHARGQRFEPQRWQYFKLLLDPGDFSLQPKRNPTSSLTPPSGWARHVRSIGDPQFGLAVCCVVSACDSTDTMELPMMVIHYTYTLLQGPADVIARGFLHQMALPSRAPPTFSSDNSSNTHFYTQHSILWSPGPLLV